MDRTHHILCEEGLLPVEVIYWSRAVSVNVAYINTKKTVIIYNLVLSFLASAVRYHPKSME